MLSGVEKTTVTRVFSARDRLVDITLDLCFIDDGDFTFDATMMNQSENSNSTRYKQIRTELTAERNLSEGGQMSAIQSTEQDVNTESYRIATRRDAPIWVSDIGLPRGKWSKFDLSRGVRRTVNPVMHGCIVQFFLFKKKPIVEGDSPNYFSISTNPTGSQMFY